MAKEPKRAWDTAGKPIDRQKLIDECKEAAAHVIDDDGEVNWRAAFFADPGVTQCPSCSEYLWWEGAILECPCGTIFDSSTKVVTTEPKP